MIINTGDFLFSLNEKLDSFDKKEVEIQIDNLISYLFKSEIPFPSKEAEKILQLLRNKRMFALMQKTADVFLQTGIQTFRIRRLYAQSLIDQGIYSAALAVLETLITDTGKISASDQDALSENFEAFGQKGRIYKQLYVNAGNPLLSQNAEFLKIAIQSYLHVYSIAPELNIWQGINAAALLVRAKSDNIQLQGFPDPDSLAVSILNLINDRDLQQQLSTWDFATAAEVCLVQKKNDEAVKWIVKYANAPYADAFELASTLRQFTEVWRLDISMEAGKKILSLLRAKLLEKEGGNIVLDANELQGLNFGKNETESYEKVFGADSFKTYKWYMTGAERCLAITRIGRDSTKGFGTGFVVKGELMHESLKNELILLTNAHVISTNPLSKALQPEEAIVIFETINRDEEFRVSEIVWSSPPEELDVSIIRFSKDTNERLIQFLKSVKDYPLAKPLPLADGNQRVYVIGHPAGGTLQLSLQDNALIDHHDPFIHYRTPTEGGSSGSPVFNQQWELIGIHHAGRLDMPKLNGNPGFYEANEGVWIQAIRRALANALQNKSGLQ